MIERPKVVAIVTIISVAGLGLLYAYAANVPPIVVSPSDIGVEHHGKMVEVSGLVTDARILSSGTILLTLCDMDNAGSIVVVIQDGLAKDFNMVPGDIISAKGIVEIYRDELQVVPSSIGDVVLLSRENPARPDPSVLLSSVSLFNGLEIEISGMATASWSEEGVFWAVLELEKGSLLAAKSNGALTIGEERLIQGIIRYDSTRGWWYIDNTM